MYNKAAAMSEIRSAAAAMDVCALSLSVVGHKFVLVLGTLLLWILDIGKQLKIIFHP